MAGAELPKSRQVYISLRERIAHGYYDLNGGLPGEQALAAELACRASPCAGRSFRSKPTGSSAPAAARAHSSTPPASPRRSRWNSPTPWRSFRHGRSTKAQLLAFGYERATRGRVRGAAAARRRAGAEIHPHALASTASPSHTSRPMCPRRSAARSRKPNWPPRADAAAGARRLHRPQRDAGHRRGSRDARSRPRAADRRRRAAHFADAHGLRCVRSAASNICARSIGPTATRSAWNCAARTRTAAAAGSRRRRPPTSGHAHA